MAIRTDREYRMGIEFRAVEQAAEEEPAYIVEGYATTFNDPYVLYEYEGQKYSEMIDRDALQDADMSDVIFLYNHEGMVFARMSNDTLEVSPNERGLYVRADLSKSQAARDMYENIKAGLVTQMSWAFTVAEDAYDEKTFTRNIMKIRKVYDVSAVSIPANPNTDISARAYFDGVIEEARRRSDRERELEEKRQAIRDIIQKGAHHE